MRDDQGFSIYGPESIGSAIKHYRQQAGLTQADLARLTGLNRTYLSSLEHGAHTAELNRLLRVLKQLGLRMTIQRVG
jgi:transcriptional regulator with XRE-family HTH domain